MNKKTSHKKPSAKREQEGITAITVAGYKSIFRETRIEIKPLTILAGPNSSGKSSMIQPLLLLKQTLEESYDPGPLLLYGPNVKFTSFDQLLSRPPRGLKASTFAVGIEIDSDKSIYLYFGKHPDKKEIELQKMASRLGKKEINILHGMSHEDIIKIHPILLKTYKDILKVAKEELEWAVVRGRCVLDLVLQERRAKIEAIKFGPYRFFIDRFGHFIELTSLSVQPHIRKFIHLPALRGNPERNYPTTAVGDTFPGTFDKYVASIVAQWQRGRNLKKLENLFNDLEKLGLTWKIQARPVDDTQVELRVGRMPRAARGGAMDLVSIADVGFGVSQALPVVVALHAAQEDHTVYLEQPEIHLHPNSQYILAEVLADAANRGVKMIVETHSSLLLRGIQTQVASKKLSPDLVKLHWFSRNEKDGMTEVTSADLDEQGRFGDWPADFDDVELRAEINYLDAAESATSL